MRARISLRIAQNMETEKSAAEHSEWKEDHLRTIFH